MRARSVLVCVVVLLVSVAPLWPAAAAPPRYGFHAPVVLPGSADGSEPSVAVDDGGHRFAFWQSPGQVDGSSDGVNFTQLTTPDPNAIGDVDVEVDSSGAVFNSQICGDLEDILHTCVYRSTDGAQTWPLKTEIADNHPGASDRPWIDVFPKRGGSGNPDDTRVYVEYHTFTPDDEVYVTTSTDGGHTFGPPTLPETGTNAAIADSACNTVPSGVAVDQTNGTVYVLWLSGNDVVANATSGCNYTQLGPFNKAWVSVSTDGGMSWLSHLAWEGSFDPVTKVGDNADKLFGAISVDLAGQVHVMLPVRLNDDPVGFVVDCEIDPNCQEDPQPTKLLMVTSPDGAETWTAPFEVKAPLGSYFFPWTAAGSKGRLDAVFYASSTLRPNDPNSVWYAYSAQIGGAVAIADGGGTHYVKPPRVVVAKVQTSPIHEGGICTFGIFCAVVPNADRTLADSIGIALDPGGGANLVYTDNHTGTNQIVFACQNSGPSAYAGRPAFTGMCFGQG